ncbi:MAG: hypothetical protein ABR998_00405 [Gemmatimonadales bacterium]|jgi:hypothetical protein
MEKSNRVPQIYGYTVCVIAVVTFLICATVVVNNVFDLANPLQAGFGATLSSFEAYQADQHPSAVGAQARPDTTSEATLRRRYEALRTDHIARVRFQAWKAIVTSGLLLLISVVLFVWHWRWMKRLGAAAEAGTA